MTRPVREWPAWWEFDLELTPHLLKRMIDRGFNEVELRRMLVHAEGLDPDPQAGRWQVVSRYAGDRWIVVVEPELDSERLVIVTAYRDEG
jgi:hypothetical protein